MDSRTATSALRVLAPLLALSGCTASPPAAPFDWRDDYALFPELTLAIDSTGYHLPTAIAFVPAPAPAPAAPLYFVAELRGAVKVVSNDRAVRPFADVDALRPEQELPAIRGQGGLAGLCLDEANGYVFATFAGADPTGVLRNSIVRFKTTPRSFAVAPSETAAIARFLAADPSAISHQIGGCQVDGDALYVAVGDGQNPGAARRQIGRAHV